MKRAMSSFALTALLITALFMALWCAGLRINTTKSIAVGFYWATKEPVRKGVYVTFCPPRYMEAFVEARKRGYIDIGLCPGNFGLVMKKIVAVKDDLITVSVDGVRVNGELMPYSAPLAADPAGRPLPLYSNRYTLEAGQVLLLSDVSRTSWDGRYYGPIYLYQIKDVIEPIYTW